MTKPSVLFLKGLPASGKSTFAKDLVAKEPDTWVRVNKDSLRTMLHDGKWSRGREKIVQSMQRAMAEQALQNGLSVVVDDTNLAPKHEDTYRQLADRYGAEFEVRLFGASVEECLERDSKRTDSVGKDVICRMFYDFMCKKPVEPIEGQNAVVFDIDGTLAKMKDRGPFEWEKVGQDELNRPVQTALKAFQETGFAVLIVSGRDGSCEELTKEWLARNQIEYDGFWMRPAGSMEKDTVIKERIYREHIEGKFNVVGVFDDRPSVVRFWRSQGLFVFDCGNGVEF
jgi:predicted kinase